MDTSPDDALDATTKLGVIAQNLPTSLSGRKAVYNAAKSLLLAAESPGDTIQRIAYSAVQVAVARVADDLNLFAILAGSGGKPMSTEDLAKATKADTILLSRILRYLASERIIQEVGEDLYSANNITETLCIPGLRAGIRHNFDTMMPCYQQLPTFLAETKYQNPFDSAHSAFQAAHNTDQHPFVWILSHPSNFANFNQWMTASREGQKIWLDVFPFEQRLCRNLSPEVPVFVDVGGGIGIQCHALKTRFPQIQGRVILQDMQQVIAQAIPMEGVELMPYDFWTPQPVKGARAYYMRNIMHDYSDDKCIAILRNTMSAMTQDSVLLIDDMILPNKGTHWQAAQLDMAMMSVLAALERSEKQWYSMLDRAGLRIESVHTYTDELQDSIIVAVPK